MSSSRLMDKSARPDSAVDGRVVHIEDVTFVDSARIDAPVDFEAVVEGRGGHAVIAAPSPHVRARLELARIGRYVSIEEAPRRADTDPALDGAGGLHQAPHTDLHR